MATLENFYPITRLIYDPATNELGSIKSHRDNILPQFTACGRYDLGVIRMPAKPGSSNLVMRWGTTKETPTDQWYTGASFIDDARKAFVIDGDPVDNRAIAILNQNGLNLRLDIQGFASPVQGYFVGITEPDEPERRWALDDYVKRQLKKVFLGPSWDCDWKLAGIVLKSLPTKEVATLKVMWG